MGNVRRYLITEILFNNNNNIGYALIILRLFYAYYYNLYILLLHNLLLPLLKASSLNRSNIKNIKNQINSKRKLFDFSHLDSLQIK